MKNTELFILLLLLSVLIFSCDTSFFAAGDNPRPKSFEYYEKFPPNNNNSISPRFDGVYIYVDSASEMYKFEDTFEYSKRVIKFYDDGLLIIYPTPMSIDRIKKATYNKKTSGNVFGFYKVKGDSIFFSTKVFYDHTEKMYQGKINDKSIILKSLIFGNKESIYKFYEIDSVSNDQQGGVMSLHE